MRPDEQSLLELMSDLEQIANDDATPATLRRRATIGLDWLGELLDAVRSGDPQLVTEHVLGTVREDGSRRPDGLAQLTPLWARGPRVLDELAGLVVVDETQRPVAVTVHWERVPQHLRREAASLASELVDAYQGRSAGGRPSKQSKEPRPETG